MINKVKNKLLGSLRQKLCPPNSNTPSRDDFLTCENLTPEDVFLVSYPRSGNTWVRTILAYMLYPPEKITSLKVLDELVPSTGRPIPEPDTPPQLRIVKTHRPYVIRHERDNPNLYRKNIYIVRHPFDVTRSFYDYTKNLGWWPERNLSLGDFVYHLNYGSLISSTWQSHLLSWYAMREQHQILFLRYEDMQAATASAIKQLAHFLDIPLSQDRNDSIIEYSSLNNMRQLETVESLVDPNYNFVRQQDKQRNAEKLTQEMKQLIWEHNHIAAEICGYTFESTLQTHQLQSQSSHET